MSIYAKRTDANQREIVAALKQVGASVQDLSRVGGGCPDLLVGFFGDNYLLEVKTTHGKLNTKQRKWFRSWRGHAVVVNSPERALVAIGAIPDQPDQRAREAGL